MANKSKLLIDTNIIFALLIKTDPNHQKILELFKQLSLERYQLVTNDYILQETCTVILFAIKNVNKTTKLIDGFIINSLLKIKYFSEKEYQSTYKIFSTQKQPRLSFADCSLITMSKIHNINQIITLDTQLKKTAKQHNIINLI